MVACSAMAFVKAQESEKGETKSKESKWARLKRGGIIGAAAITGGTLLAITGGMETMLSFVTVLWNIEFPHESAI